MKNQNKIIIREAYKNELSHILSLYKDLHENDDPLPKQSELNRIWDDINKNPFLKYFVLETEGEIVSTCTLSIIPNLTRGARPFGLIENLVTEKNHQGKGFGMSIIKFALKNAWDLNCYKVMLLTSRKDKKILKFYEKAGFQKGVKTGFVAYRGNFKM